jgi:hypothetical protein
VQSFKDNLLSQAIEEYQAAYSIQPYPLILYNIARIYHKQNQLSQAIAYYNQYIGSAHREQAERVRELLSEAQRALAQQAPRTEEDRATVSPPAVPESSALGLGTPALPQAVGAPSPPAPPPEAGTPVVPLPPGAVSNPPASLERHTRVPVYKRWWFWTIGGVVAVGAATAIGLAVVGSRPDISGLPSQTFSPSH